MFIFAGKQSLETICLLLAYKIKYPENFFLLRGNHECASINRIYGFYDECKISNCTTDLLLTNDIQVKEGTISSCGRHSPTVSTVSPSPRLLTRRSSVVTGDWVQTCRAWSRSGGSWDLQTSLTQVRLQGWPLTTAQLKVILTWDYEPRPSTTLRHRDIVVPLFLWDSRIWLIKNLFKKT